VLDLAQYTLKPLRSDAELALFGGVRNGHDEASRPSIDPTRARPMWSGLG
jgi:hypothetical protein